MRVFALIAVQGALVAAAAVLAMSHGAPPPPEVAVLGHETSADAAAEPGSRPTPVVLPARPVPAPPPVPVADRDVDAAFAAFAARAPVAALMARSRMDALLGAVSLRPEQLDPLARLLLRHAERDISDRARLNPRLRIAAASCRGWYRAAGPERAEAAEDILPALRRIDPELDRLFAEREAFEAEAKREVAEVLDPAQFDALDRSGAFALMRR